MRSLTRILVVALASLGVAIGCGGRGPIEPGDGGSTGGHGGGSSGGHSGSAGTAGSAADCGPKSQPIYCPDCEGNEVFNRCFDDPGADPACPALTCPAPAACADLDKATCKVRSDCQLDYCCGGEVYTGCGLPGAKFTCMVSCPAPPPSCAGLDEMTCSSTPGCSAQSCSTCTAGQFTYAACYRSDVSPPPCIEPSCTVLLACSGLNETTCKTRGDCSAQYCPDCKGGQTFVGCGAPGSIGGPGCAECLAPPPCANVTDEATCDARTDCHSVFVDPGTCACAAVGCCTHFAFCGGGSRAACKGPTGSGVCERPPPFCEAPAYVVSYTANCYEGCVRPSECAP